MPNQLPVSCAICGFGGPLPLFEARENMFATHDLFQYSECPSCGTLALQTPPPNMAPYYPSDYYSFGNLKEKEVVGGSVRNFVKRKVIEARLGKPVFGRSLWQKRFPDYLEWLLPQYFTFNSSILDVGCGSGFFLLSMANAGFTNLQGIDPYNATDIRYRCGVEILKKDLFEVSETYDVVMMHHAYEHMENPEAILNQVWKCLKANGIALIRIPVADAEAWKTYGPLWVQLDAPRHYYLHTVKGLRLLADRTRFKVDHILFDSYNLQFWGSELYKQGKKLSVGPTAFTAGQLAAWSQNAKALNKQAKGDQLCIYLRKIG